MQAILTHLIGLPVEINVRKTTFVAERKQGVFGTCCGYFVIEVQMRQALHFHGVVAAGLVPRLMQNVADYPGLVLVVAEALKTQICTELSPAHHVLHAARLVLHKPAQSAAYQQAPSPAADVPGATPFADRAVTNAATLNFHEHKPTCHKGKTGEFGCRGCMPAAHPVPITRAVQLLPLQSDDASAAAAHVGIAGAAAPQPVAWRCLECGCHCPDAMRVVEVQPRMTGARDHRCITWETQRPLVPPFEALAATENASDDDALAAVCVMLSTPDVAKALACEGVTEDLREVLRNVTAIQAHKLVTAWRGMTCANGNLVPFNDVLTAVLGCNTAPLMVGGNASAQSSMYYMVKYMSKESTELRASLSVMAEAYKHIQTYPSVAPDSGESVRTAQHLTNRFLNSLEGDKDNYPEHDGQPPPSTADMAEREHPSPPPRTIATAALTWRICLRTSTSWAASSSRKRPRTALTHAARTRTATAARTTTATARRMVTCATVPAGRATSPSRSTRATRCSRRTCSGPTPRSPAPSLPALRRPSRRRSCRPARCRRRRGSPRRVPMRASTWPSSVPGTR